VAAAGPVLPVLRGGHVRWAAAGRLGRAGSDEAMTAALAVEDVLAGDETR
jgi:hypothetical protein